MTTLITAAKETSGIPSKNKKYRPVFTSSIKRAVMKKCTKKCDECAESMFCL